MEQKKPLPGEKGQYGYVRQAEEKPKRTRKKKIQAIEQISHAQEFDGMNGIPPHPAGVNHLPPMEVSGMGTMDHLHHAMVALQDLSDVGNDYSTILPTPSSVPLDRSTIRNSPAEEEMDDMEEGTEWAVRIGDSSPPTWGKRKAVDEGYQDKDKRPRFQTSVFLSVRLLFCLISFLGRYTKLLWLMVQPYTHQTNLRHYRRQL